jgi:hypothetical protein
MQKLKPIIRGHSIKLIFLTIMVVIGFVIFLAYHMNGSSIHIRLFFDQNKGIFFIWRIIALILFFFTWPMVVRHYGKRNGWTAHHINKAIQSRYYYLVLLSVVELIFSIGGLL